MPPEAQWDNDPDASLGSVLLRHRLRVGLSQDQVAALAGISVRALRDIEKGRVALPQARSLSQLVGALGLSGAERDRVLSLAGGRGSPAGRAPGASSIRPPGGVRLQVLGPLQVVERGRPVPLTSRRQQTLLGLLAVHHGQAVSRAEIIDLLWGATPPRTVSTLLHSHVAAVRTVLEPRRAARRSSCLAALPDGGYRLELDEQRLDAVRFAALTRDARAARAADDPLRAVELFEQALDCWQGAALAGADAALREHPSVVRLNESRLTAVLEHADLALSHPGDPAQVSALIERLLSLVGEHPLSERLHARLITALAAGGERPAALDAYARLRERLADELGVDPGTEVEQAYLRVLREPSGQRVAASAASAATGAAARDRGASGSAGSAAGGSGDAGGETAGDLGGPEGGAPSQLPPGVSAFTGRGTELGMLDALLGEPQPGVVAIATITGTAGVGKTALALHWSHRSVARFPDGQLYADLRGYSASEPVDPADALAAFLRALGVPGAEIPLDTAERAALFRSRTASRRLLVMLDNAATVEQVRPLLPGPGPAVVLITSRDSLAGLVAREGAQRIGLDLLPEHEALELLRRLLGDRVTAEPEAAAELVEQCARLPLALRVAAELAAATTQPGPAAGADRPLARLTQDLLDEQVRLTALSATGDPESAVRAVLSWSYRQLPPDAARGFRLLGAQPAARLDVHAAAALFGTEAGTARQILDRLARAHLVQRRRDGRVAMHDLLRAFAAELVSEADGAPAAVRQLLDHYRSTTAAAIGAVSPAALAVGHPELAAASTLPGIGDPIRARLWLEAERVTLVAAAGYAVQHGLPRHGADLASLLAGHLYEGAYCTEALDLHGSAIEAGRALGDPAIEGTAHRNRCVIYWLLGRYDEALADGEAALELLRAAQDDTGVGRTLNNLGILSESAGRYPAAIDYYHAALELAEAQSDALTQARVVCNLSGVYERLGQYRQALRASDRALQLFTRLGDRTGLGRCLHNSGVLHERLGQTELAGEQLEQALALFRETDDRADEAHALAELGTVRLKSGDHHGSDDYLAQALSMFEQIGDRGGETQALSQLALLRLGQGRPSDALRCAERAAGLAREVGNPGHEALALNRQGEVLLALRRTDEALARHHAALAIARQIGDPVEQARSLDGVGRVLAELGDPEPAAAHWQQALALYVELEVPAAEEVRARLAAVHRPRGAG